MTTEDDYDCRKAFEEWYSGGDLKHYLQSWIAWQAAWKRRGDV